MKLNELGVKDAAKVGANVLGATLGYDKGRKNAEKILARNNFANNFVKTVLANIKAQGIDTKPSKPSSATVDTSPTAKTVEPAATATPTATSTPATATAVEPTTPAASVATSPADAFAAKRIAKQKTAQAQLDKAGGQFSPVKVQPKTPEEIRKAKQAAAIAAIDNPATPKIDRSVGASARARAKLARPRVKEDLSNLEEALTSVLEDGPAGPSLEKFLNAYIPQYMSGYDISPFASKIEPLINKVVANPSKSSLKELGGILYDIASESERKGLYNRLGKSTATKTDTSGQFSEPVGVGKDLFVKGPNGWVSAKDKKTPASGADIPMLDKLLAAATKSGATVAPDMSGVGKLALDNVKQLTKADHADDLEEIIKVALNKLYGISKEDYAKLLGTIKK